MLIARIKQLLSSPSKRVQVTQSFEIDFLDPKQSRSDWGIARTGKFFN